MATESAERKKANRKSKKRARGEFDPQLERLESLPWSSSLPASDGGADDDLSLFMGSNELDGGASSINSAICVYFVAVY